MKKGFLFDLDGLLVDTQTPFHARAECEVLKDLAIIVEPIEISHRFAGISTETVFEELVPGCDPKELVAKKWRIMNKLSETEQIKEMPGMFMACHFLLGKGVPINIVSASPLAWIERCLVATDFDKLFGHHYVSAEECRRGKPAPDIILEAINRRKADQVDQWYMVGDGRSDMLAGLNARPFMVNACIDMLYLSKNDTEFDQHGSVKRFQTSRQLARYIKQIAI